MKAVRNITTKEELIAFAREMTLPDEVAEELPYEEGIQSLVSLLNDPLRAEEGADELREALSPDENGFRILAAMLRAAGTAGERALFCGMLVAVWLIVNELISVLENLAAVGVPGFAPLQRLLRHLKDSVEDRGGEK